MGYDASGNLTSSNGQTMTYDAEGMITAYADTHGNSASYKYTADNDRVRKDANGSWTEYVEFGGNILAEKNADGSWTDYIYAAGTRIAKAAGSTPTGTQYYHADHLGTARLMTDSTGAVLSNCTYTPFGAEQPSSPSNPANHYKFTGKERDSESSMDYFGGRYYAGNMGRWMSPDWSPKPSPVPFADLENPQSLNLYGYVGNDPLSRTDGDGHLWQELVNLWKWGHYVNNAGLDKALQGDADRARSDLSGMKNFTLNGKTPAEFAKGANNQQAIMAERTVTDFLTSKVMQGLVCGSCDPNVKIGILFPIDFPTSATVNWSATFATEGEARAFARTQLGSDAVEVEPGKWRSSDGRWQYRAKPGDVVENHVHLEELKPNGEVKQNLYLRWPDGGQK